MISMTAARPIGDLLRDWRQHRRLSQLDLALEAEVSSRHISFLQTGRSRPSREMLLRLAEQLAIPLRERNGLLIAAGFAPSYPERSLNDDALQSARQAVDLVLTGHEPYPAMAIDRQWTLVAANRAVGPFFVGMAPALVQPPINVLRATLHPEGLAPRIANFAQWRAHLLARLRRQVEITADPTLVELLEELRGYPAPGNAADANESDRGREVADVVVPLRLRTDHGILAFLYTTTIFGTPVDVTLAELAIEAFFPADPVTAGTLRRASGNSSASPSDLTDP